ncbi:related to serine/threonine-protein kinase [Rhynchosporium agropyri]|uniref:EKC/KEOPS complex subunit BUD32 n=1 Tax=Rhynchosporium agropyri TaxID=914238 RepID=A0A1E1JSB4_9HELO|nr:related to serine/threonine-protein kinase [Rhynchosporium agropyri]
MPDRRFTSVTPSDAIEEELLPHYNARHFFPVEPGKVFRERYETISKLGYGSGSTVWLARDLDFTKSKQELERSESEPYVVLKFCTCDYSNKEAAEHELQVGRCLAGANLSHKGVLYLQTVIEGFEVLGPNGMHMCLVFEPMRETLSLFQSRLKQKRFPLKLLKMYLICLLTGLDYLHSECHIIHTDLSLQNILVNFEDDSVLDEFAQAQIENPMLQKKRDGYSIYQSHNQFGQLRTRLGPIVPKIADFGHAQWITESEPQINPIQPDYYRAPEVILGIGWSYSADIWNLGVLLWTMLEGTGKNLFHHIHSSNGKYMAQNHLAQMIALLGLPPAELVARGIEMRKWNFTPAIENDEAKLCHKAYQFYKGPFFDNEGTFLYPELVPKLGLESTISSLEGEEKRAFLEFVVNHMLCWVPERRKTAKECLEHPWLKGIELPWELKEAI